MLAAELKKFSAEVRLALEPERRLPLHPAPPVATPRPAPLAFPFPVPPASVPCAQQQPNRPSAQTGSNPEACSDALGGLRLGLGGGGSSIAQSLPSHSHMAMHMAPRKPRVHPSPAPSFAGVPLMALRRVEYVCSRVCPRTPPAAAVGVQCTPSAHPVHTQPVHTSAHADHGLQAGHIQASSACRGTCPYSKCTLHAQSVCTSSAHAVHMQCTCRARAVHMQCTRGAHAVHTRCTRSAHAVHTQCTHSAHAVHKLQPSRPLPCQPPSPWPAALSPPHPTLAGQHSQPDATPQVLGLRRIFPSSRPCPPL